MKKKQEKFLDIKKTDIKNVVDGLNNRMVTAKGQPDGLENNLWKYCGMQNKKIRRWKLRDKMLGDIKDRLRGPTSL